MNPNTGGVCQGIRNTLPEIESLGYRSDVVCLDGRDATYDMQDSFPVIRLGARRGPWSYSRHLHRWLIESLPQYDAVVTNGLWLYHSFAVSRAVAGLKRKKTTNIPRVYVMPHGMLDPWFQRTPSRRLKAYRNWLYWKTIENRVISQADGILFTCQRELELARETFRPYRPQRETNIGYGVPAPPPRNGQMERAFRRECPTLGDQRYLLFLSRIHPKKGVDLLLRAYAKVAANASSGAMPALVIAGPKESAYATEMQQLAQQLGLARSGARADSGVPGVHFPGMLRDDAKWGAFYGCDAFVLPSHQENFGIAVVEALACGKPVLVSDQVNIWKEISDSNAGIARPDSLDGTQQLLEAWLDPKAHLGAMKAEDCLSCFRRYFLPQAAAQNLVQALAG
nr:glycosyltransferase [Rhodopirellula sp. JC639]